MKSLIITLLLLVSPFSFANESSIQWYIQPLKVKCQVGEKTMTEVGLYRFPLFMYHTHPAITLNYICRENKLTEYTVIKKKNDLSDVNLASLYGLDVTYDLGDDVTVVDLTKVKKPEGETISEEEVIAMTLECVRLSPSGSPVTILTTEKTKKWKLLEEKFRKRELKTPLYVVKTVPRKLAKGERLYHSVFWHVGKSENVPGPLEFLTYGGDSEDYYGSDTSYNGIGLSKKIRVSNDGDVFYQAEFNPLAGYRFLKKDGVLTIIAPTWPQKTKSVMDLAIECAKLTAKAKGENTKDFKLRIVDFRLTKAQHEGMQKLFEKGDIEK